MTNTKLTLLESIYGYFCQRFHSLRETGGAGWYSFNDPYSHKKDGSSRVNFETAWVVDWRSGLTQSCIDYIQELEGLKSFHETLDFLGYEIYPKPLPLMVKPVRPSVSNVPKMLSLFDHSKDNIYVKGLEYLTLRGFSLEFLDSLGVGICLEDEEYSGRIIIPYIEDNETVYYTARDYFYGALPKYKNPKNGETLKNAGEIIYNSPALNSPTAYLMEGVFCAFTLLEKHFPAAAIGGWQLTSKKKSIISKSPCKEVIVFADKGFYKKTCLEYLWLTNHKNVKIVNFDKLPEGEKDVNDIGALKAITLAGKTDYLSYKSVFNGL